MTPSQLPYKIVVGFDFSAPGRHALAETVRVAALHPVTQVHLATVIDSDHAELIPPPQRHTSLVQIADDLRERLAGVGIETIAELRARRPDAAFGAVAHVRLGSIAEQLVELAADVQADLVIVGTHGRRGFKRMTMGSVAEKTARLAPCPVLVARPRDFSGSPRPALEPACPDCLARRTATNGAFFWCEAHERAPEPAHVYSRTRRIDYSPAVAGTIRF